MNEDFDAVTEYQDGAEFVIYKLTMISSGKVYIGQTKNLKKRLSSHSHKPPSKMKKALGKSDFKSEIFVEVLESHVKGQKSADAMEENYIKAYDSIKKGFNKASSRNCKSIFSTGKIRKFYRG